MKLSRNWLSDFIDLSGLSNAELSEIITTRIAEVDSISESGKPLESARICQVLAIAPHPTKGGLSLATVNVGKEQLTIVCDAPNLKEGLVTAYIPVGGAILRDGALQRVEAREVAGVRSEGLLASPRELDIGCDHESGVIELQHGNPGAFVREELSGVDLIIEIDNKSLTHRPDLWSHFGFARELSAVLNRPLKLDLDNLTDDTPSGAEKFSALLQGKESVRILAAPETKLRRMIACIFENVQASASPSWMKRRLYSVGAGVKNFLVDLSNYVMHDCGQPNHFFDADRIASDEIHIRFAREGERLTTLDQVERVLSSEDLVIADRRSALDIGGIIGGNDSSVCERTTRILFTSGTWDPVIVRKSAQRHQCRTDAAQRYEKNLSPFLPVMALERVRALLPQGCPNANISGRVSDAFLHRPHPERIELSSKLVRERLGSGAPDFRQCCDILSRLRLRFVERDEERCLVEVPHYRATRDLLIPEDLIEEIGRCHGYENIHEAPPLVASNPSSLPPIRELEHEIRDLLRGAGFSEVSNYSFVDPTYSEELGYVMSEAVRIANPMDSQQGAMRVSLIPGMIDVLSRNERYFDAVHVFEIGRSYHLRPEERFQHYRTMEALNNIAAFERNLLCIATLGEGNGFSPLGKIAGLEFYSLLSLLRRVLSLRTGAELTTKTLESSQVKAWMHPYRAAEMLVGELSLGGIAEVRPGLALKGRAVIAELELDTLLELSARRKYSQISKYPSSLFEMSIVCPKRTEYRVLNSILREVSPVIKSIEVLSIYEGKPLAPGEKSVSVRLTLADSERTLPSEEVSEIQSALMANVERHGYALRRS